MIKNGKNVDVRCKTFIIDGSIFKYILFTIAQSYTECV